MGTTMELARHRAMELSQGRDETFLVIHSNEYREIYGGNQSYYVASERNWLLSDEGPGDSDEGPGDTVHAGYCDGKTIDITTYR